MEPLASEPPDLMDIMIPKWVYNRIVALLVGIYKSGYLEIRDLAGSPIIMTQGFLGATSDFQPWLELLENASFIQERLRSRIPTPASPTVWDLELTRKLKEFLKNGSVELSRDYSFGFGFTRTDVDRALKELGERGFVENLLIEVAEYKAKLFGRELSLGPARIAVPRARPIESLADIEKHQRDLGDAKDMWVQFIACGERPPVAYLANR